MPIRFDRKNIAQLMRRFERKLLKKKGRYPVHNRKQAVKLGSGEKES